MALSLTNLKWVFKQTEVLRRFGLVVVGFGLMSALLTGCGSAGNLASNFGLKSPEAVVAKKSAVTNKSVAFATIVGAPTDVSTKVLHKLKASAREKSINVTDEITSASYLVRGYLVATPQVGGGKLSYIWDINNRQGVRIHRLQGNQFLKGAKTSNGWSLVDDAAIGALAESSSTQLRGWIGTQAGEQPVEGKSGDDLSNPKNISPVAKRQLGTPGDPVITGAVGKSPNAMYTHVLPVYGAPGDGRISLTNALRRELKKSGVKLSDKKMAGMNGVQGNVKLLSAGEGRQKVSIIWQVIDASGNRIGTVSQENLVPAGSLNGAWGKTAEAAASAAAKGIAKLLPPSK